MGWQALAVWAVRGCVFGTCACDGGAALGYTCLQDGKTPCYWSALKGKDKCLAMLIEAGCDINTPDMARAVRE